MKKLLFVFATALLLLSSCGGGPSIVGTWQLESISGEELSEREKSSTITFTEDGKVEQQRGDKVREGNWSLSEDGKTLTLTLKNKEEVFKDVEITEEKMSFKDREDIITLKRK